MVRRWCGRSMNDCDQMTMDTKRSTLRTSTSDPIRVDFLPFPLPGRVGLTFAPGKCDGIRWQRSLAQDLDRLQAHYGVSHLVSLIEDHELAQYEIGNLYAEAERRGIATHRFPIRDVSVPADVDCVARWSEGSASVSS